MLSEGERQEVGAEAEWQPVEVCAARDMGESCVIATPPRKANMEGGFGLTFRLHPN